MDSSTNRASEPATSDDADVRELYRQLLAGWNARDASAMAALFAEDGNVVGFDGSQIDGRAAIAVEMGRIFADHQTAAYVAKVREVRLLSGDAVLLRAVVGMVPPGQSEINPAVNAVQSLVVTRVSGSWQIALFQNTPAQFHGRPEAARRLTDELRELLQSASGS